MNGENKDDTALGRLMSDFDCVDPQKMKYKLLASSAGYYKHNKEGVQAMCRIVEEIVEKERIEIVLKMIKDGSLILSISLEKIILCLFFVLCCSIFERRFSLSARQ